MKSCRIVDYDNPDKLTSDRWVKIWSFFHHTFTIFNYGIRRWN